MPKFRVYLITTYRTIHSVEADDEEEAAERALDSAYFGDADVIDVEPEDIVVDDVEEEG